MPEPLSASTTLMCPHGGVGRILTTGTTVRTASGAPVAKMTDPTVIDGCPFLINGTPRPCRTVQWLTGNTKLLIDGTPSLDVTSMGLCQGSGIPGGPVLIVRP